jgi:hypothetical protein
VRQTREEENVLLEERFEHMSQGGPLESYLLHPLEDDQQGPIDGEGSSGG